MVFNTLSVAFARTVHYPPAWAMRFAGAEGQTIGYTTDTGPSANLAHFLAGVDLFLAESTLLEPGT